VNGGWQITITLLVVDDEPLVREFVTDALSLYGYRVLQAKHGVDALRVLKEESLSDISLVLTDITMPTMDGIELSKRIRECDPTAKMLFMSGYMDSDATVESLAEQKEPLLEKPFTPQELLQRVSGLLEV
jgi:DNA-binding response OmpR family regulator